MKKDYCEKKSIKLYITPVALQCRLTVSPSVAVTCRMQCDTSEQELGIIESNVGEKCCCTYSYIIQKTWQPTRPFVGSGATLGATWNHFCQIMKKRHHLQRKRKATCAKKRKRHVKREKVPGALKEKGAMHDCKTFTTQTFTTPDVHHLRRSPPPV